MVLIGVYRTANLDTAIGFWESVALGFGFEASLEKVIFPKSGTGKVTSADRIDATIRQVDHPRKAE